MTEGYTKLYKRERELLLKTNSVAAYEIYMHLKDKYSYFNKECYDLEKNISSYLNIPLRTIKDVINRLKKVGLLSVTKKGKVNIYGFPILEGENNTNKAINPQDDTNIPQEIESVLNGLKMPLKEEQTETDEDMGNYTGIKIELKDTVRESRPSRTEIDCEKVVKWLENKRPLVYQKMMNVPKSYYPMDENIKRLRETMNCTMNDIFHRDRELIEGIYLYISKQKVEVF